MTQPPRPVDVEIRVSGTDADRAAVLAALAGVLEFTDPPPARRNRRDPGARVYLRVTAVRDRGGQEVSADGH